METIAVYGKGGIGKSVVATSLSVLFAQSGRRVLHVGCDPKHDSAQRLLKTSANIRTVLDILKEDPEVLRTAPHNTARRRLNEAKAARDVILSWREHEKRAARQTEG